MNRSFLLSTVLLTTGVLIGCSNDEGGAVNQQILETVVTEQRGDLRMAFDPFDDEADNTRTLRNNNFGQLTFQENDLVYVYTYNLQFYDFYTFKTDGFYFDVEKNGGTTPWVDTPTFGIMRGATSKELKGYIERTSRTYRVDVEIPRIFVYDANAESANIDGRGTRGYRCDLPMFGYASYSTEGSYIEISKMRYMVAVLRININGFAGKARFLRLSNTAGKPLSGNVTAILYTNPDNRKQTKLEVLDPDLPIYTDIYVDLTNAPSSAACIYLPVVPGLVGSSDGIKLEYSNDASHDNAIEATGWKTCSGVAFTGITFGQHKRYTVDCSF